MHKNKYKSYEEKTQNVWFNIWNDGETNKSGSIEVVGDTASGYRIIRRGSLLTNNIAGLSNIVLGDAGVYFEKRKDAENFALVLAMHFSGDLPTEDFLDPTVFNGYQSDRMQLSKARTNLFWQGCANINPTQGWAELDPKQILQKLPNADEPLPNDEAENESNLRAYGISEMAEAVFDFYVSSFLTEDVKRPLYQLVAELLKAKAECYGEIATEDRGYVTLLALSMLRNKIPVSWIFTSSRDEVQSLIPRLWESLPADVKAYIEECEAETIRSHDRAAKVQAMEDKIISSLPHALAEDNWEVRSRVICCARHLIEVSEGSTEPPNHSEPDYVILMQSFTEKALLNADDATEWLAKKLTNSV